MKATYYVSLVGAILLLGACEIIVEEPYYHKHLDGNYAVEEYSEIEAAVFYYDVHIRRSTFDRSKIIITNLYETSLRVKATLHNQEEKIRIPYQVVDGFAFEGVGTIFGEDEISISYSVHDLRGHSHFTDYLQLNGAKSW